MTLNHEQDLQMLQIVGQIVAETLACMRKAAQPGMSTGELDAIGAAYLRERGARSAPQLTYGFPGATCISVSPEVAHGIPGTRILKAGDLINIDVSAEWQGYFADTGASFCLPGASPQRQELCQRGEAILAAVIPTLRPGMELRAIGRKFEALAKQAGLFILRELGGHGVGRALHEEPGFIAAHYQRHDRRRLHKDQVITLEPFLALGRDRVVEERDGWTLATALRHDAVQFEHSLVITEQEPIVLTRLVAA
jgi:methionyl aminopeptidase